VRRLGSNWEKLARGPWPETIIDEGSFDLSLSLSLSLSLFLSFSSPSPDVFLPR
jgi:hypothetical protein